MLVYDLHIGLYAWEHALEGTFCLDSFLEKGVVFIKKILFIGLGFYSHQFLKLIIKDHQILYEVPIGSQKYRRMFFLNDFHFFNS